MEPRIGTHGVILADALRALESPEALTRSGRPRPPPRPEPATACEMGSHIERASHSATRGGFRARVCAEASVITLLTKST